MPATFYSTATTEFGLEAESSLGFLVDSFSYEVSSDKAELYDEAGDLVHVHRYNKKGSISISGVGTTSLRPGETITSLSNTAAGQLDGTILVDSVTTGMTSDGFQTVEISLTQYDATLALQS